VRGRRSRIETMPPLLHPASRTCLLGEFPALLQELARHKKNYNGRSNKLNISRRHRERCEALNLL
jgi:hypothetical protein